MQGSCRLGPGLVQMAGSEQDTLSMAVLVWDVSPSTRGLTCVAFVLLVAWEESDLRGQVSVVGRNCPHTPRTAVPSPQSRTGHPEGSYNSPAAE